RRRIGGADCSRRHVQCGLTQTFDIALASFRKLDDLLGEIRQSENLNGKTKPARIVRSVCATKKRNLAAGATVSSFSTSGGLIHDHPSPFCHYSVGACPDPEQLLELTQEHIRPLIPLIDRLNEAGAEDELKVISRQLTRLYFRAGTPQR